MDFAVRIDAHEMLASVECDPDLFAAWYRYVTSTERPNIGQGNDACAFAVDVVTREY